MLKNTGCNFIVSHNFSNIADASEMRKVDTWLIFKLNLALKDCFMFTKILRDAPNVQNYNKILQRGQFSRTMFKLIKCSIYPFPPITFTA